MRTVYERCYLDICDLDGTHRETRHLDCGLEKAKEAASRASIYGNALVSVHSNLENNPLDSWVAGSHFSKYENALDYARGRAKKAENHVAS